MNQLIVVIAFATFKWVESASCPDAYRRFSADHTFCLPRNPTCQIRTAGISEDYKKLILKTHNEYRNTVATGAEKRAGGLPPASNMMQMEWDDELAVVAQKWAENCKFAHDCNDCRGVENFAVGQNIGYQQYSCSGDNCVRNPDWYSFIQDLYEEVNYFDKKFIKPYVFSLQYGHFSQIIWADTWRIGCGYVLYNVDNTYRHFFVCNYGPSGNSQKGIIYKEGNLCTACPVNSCCGEKCKGKAESYPGLCKMLNPKVAPEYPMKTDDLFFNCDLTEGNPDCIVSPSGTLKWGRKTSLRGDYYFIVLDGGETSTVVFEKSLKPKTNNFCLQTTFRKSAMLAGQADNSSLALGLNKGSMNLELPLTLTSKQFVPFRFNLGLSAPIRFSLSFSVPNGAVRHVFEVKSVIAFDGKCEERKE